MAIGIVEGRAKLMVLCRGAWAEGFWCEGLQRSPMACRALPILPPWMSGGAPMGMWQPGHRVSLALGLGGPQSSALQHQAPWEGTLGG